MDQALVTALVDYESKLIERRHKFGVLYCRENQPEEDQWYNNGNSFCSISHMHICACTYIHTHTTRAHVKLRVCIADTMCAFTVETSKDFEEFLPVLGEKIVLQVKLTILCIFYAFYF